LDHPLVTSAAVVIHPDDRSRYEASAAALSEEHRAKLLPPVGGGDTRQASVRLGLESLRHDGPDFVLVHDAARPFVDAGLIARAIAAVQHSGAAIPGVPVTDTIKVVGDSGRVVDTPDRARLRAVQTPQAFRFLQLLDVHQAAHAAGREDFTDDAALMEWAGFSVEVFEGDPRNVKLTRASDFSDAEQRLTEPSMTYVTRLGMGFDVHAFAEGDHVWLGGIRIPHSQGVIAHSDGDVVLHALTDAVLGAIADGDIGVHFPPSDPRWKGAASDQFLAYAVERVRACGGLVDHLDVTLLCEAPRLGPYREEMRQRIAGIAGVRVDQVSLKATTTEKLGFTGRREGLAAQAAATIRVPEATG
jgi:2-C-methyl-D-erythritol 4-phosphate cytidylyltransferase/2-C-methyl-D-erythritol 2,4-cyclodiphosphate synthase